MTSNATVYDDGRITCDDDGITIRWYYLWGAKHIPYKAIRSATTYQLTPLRGKRRLWGSSDFKHWYNLDGSRPGKETGIELDLGRSFLPCITPDDVEAVSKIIALHVIS